MADEKGDTQVPPANSPEPAKPEVTKEEPAKPETVKPEAVKPETQEPAGAPEKGATTATTAVKPEAPKLRGKKARPSNCSGCNKSIRKKRWYYRNGKSYCTKRCWKSTLKQPEKRAAA